MPCEIGALLRNAVGDLYYLLSVQFRHSLNGTIQRWPSRDCAEIFFDETLGLRRVEVSGDDERHIVRRVICLEELFNVIQVRRSQVFVDAYHVVGVWVTVRI